MAWYEDLSECDYFGNAAHLLRAIGWLERGKSFSTGEIKIEVLEKLSALRKHPWTSGYTVFRGYHDCDICRLEEGTINLFIPANGFLYVCPELITHYIVAHKYLPPDDFCEAVLKCPPMDSMEYKTLLLENGGKFLLE